MEEGFAFVEEGGGAEVVAGFEGAAEIGKDVVGCGCSDVVARCGFKSFGACFDTVRPIACDEYIGCICTFES